MAKQYLSLDDQPTNAAIELIYSDGRAVVCPLVLPSGFFGPGSYRYQPLVWDDGTATWIPAPNEVRANLFRSDLGSSTALSGDTGVLVSSAQGGARLLAGGSNGPAVDLSGPDLGDNRLELTLGITAPTPTLVSVLTGGVVLTGFNGETPIAKPTVAGSRGGNAALASLLTALDALGLLTDSTTA
jgi:hypothetical protein